MLSSEALITASLTSSPGQASKTAICALLRGSHGRPRSLRHGSVNLAQP
jgi:hypothetical protein